MIADFKRGHQTAFVVTTAAGLEGRCRSELRKLLGEVEFRDLFLKGNLLLLCDLPEAEVAERVKAAETTYVARMSPVQLKLRAAPDKPDLQGWAKAVVELGVLQVGETFTVKCRRRGAHQWTAREVEKGLGLALQELTGAQGEYLIPATYSVCVEVYQDLAFVGIARSEHMVEKELREMRKYAPGTRPLNRAQWKLREALQAFDISPHPDSRALDLGSAPGGWASVLSGLCREVVAVDTANLAPPVAAFSNITHLRIRAEELQSCAQELGKFDLLTNDMNSDPDVSARLMCDCADLLSDGAQAIMTIKFVTRERERHEHEVLAILQERYTDIVVRKLPHNKFETTVVMRKR